MLTFNGTRGLVNVDPAHVIAVEESGSGTNLYTTSGAIPLRDNRADVFSAIVKAREGATPAPAGNGSGAGNGTPGRNARPRARAAARK